MGKLSNRTRGKRALLNGAFAAAEAMAEDMDVELEGRIMVCLKEDGRKVCYPRQYGTSKKVKHAGKQHTAKAYTIKEGKRAGVSMPSKTVTTSKYAVVVHKPKGNSSYISDANIRHIIAMKKLGEAWKKLPSSQKESTNFIAFKNENYGMVKAAVTSSQVNKYISSLANDVPNYIQPKTKKSGKKSK